MAVLRSYLTGKVTRVGDVNESPGVALELTLVVLSGLQHVDRVQVCLDAAKRLESNVAGIKSKAVQEIRAVLIEPSAHRKSRTPAEEQVCRVWL